MLGSWTRRLSWRSGLDSHVRRHRIPGMRYQLPENLEPANYTRTRKSLTNVKQLQYSSRQKFSGHI